MKFTKAIENGKTCVHVDMEGANIPGVVGYEHLTNFRIDTYAVLKNPSRANWEVVFDITNKFIATLTPDEQIEFAKFLFVSHYNILNKSALVPELVGSELLELESELSRDLAELNRKLCLLPRLVRFTEQNIAIPSFNGVGERAQDSAEMTFYRDDVIKLTAVVLLCKMLTPVFGVFIESCKKKMDNLYKEMHCVAILKDIFAGEFRPLIDKTKNYIANIAKPLLSKISITHVWNGFTSGVINNQVYANIFVRRFIAVDLFKQNGNLLVYITSCVRAALQTQFAPSGFKTAVGEITINNEQSSFTGEEGNISTLEAESSDSAYPLDFGPIVNMAVRRTIETFAFEHELPQDVLERAFAFYDVSHISLNLLSHHLMCILFGNALCGAKSIEMLDGKDVNRMVPILQLYLIKQGYFDLVHLVTARTNGSQKTFLTGTDNTLRSVWNSSYEYRNCSAKFPIEVNGLTWDTCLHAIVDEFTTTIYTYNTAPAVWDMLGQELINSSQIQASESMARSICSFILQHQVE